MADTEKELLFYYPFDGDLTDKSPNNYPLSSNGHSFAEGRFGQALSLNGNAQYLDFNTTGTVNTKDTQYTICTWVYDEETAVPTSGTTENGNFFSATRFCSRRKTTTEQDAYCSTHAWRRLSLAVTPECFFNKFPRQQTQSRIRRIVQTGVSGSTWL